MAEERNVSQCVPKKELDNMVHFNLRHGDKIHL
jgi:hypothetical protein